MALGILSDPARGFKDTAANILATGEFVINLVPERLVQAMNLTAADAPRGVDELALAGLATLPSVHIAPPRIADSPVAFECRLHSSVITGPQQSVIIGSVLAVHIEDRYLLNPAGRAAPSGSARRAGSGRVVIRPQAISAAMTRSSCDRADLGRASGQRQGLTRLIFDYAGNLRKFS